MLIRSELFWGPVYSSHFNIFKSIIDLMMMMMMMTMTMTMTMMMMMMMIH